LFILATTGIVGGLAFLFLLFRILFLCIKRKKQTAFSLAVYASFIGVLVSAFFNNSLFYVFILEWILLMLGLVVAEKE
jgi:O-antigen ligase